ncbi:hypothetical protein MUP77_23785 [Candidatus Bathyarchaeota archaeon]|nr:hypothetical protein [Candidatus Bathyarchaeota archaeon]
MVKVTRLGLLVGDNPFHGVSHLSQARTRSRDKSLGDTNYDAYLVNTALENGANGFMFSSSETTLSIIAQLANGKKDKAIGLYAIVPYAYEYARFSTTSGGISGLVKRFLKQVGLSGKVKAVAGGAFGLLQMDPAAILRTYLTYEVSRIKSVMGTMDLNSVFLHEMVTDMGLALNISWLFDEYIDFMIKIGVKPGFETRNFAYLVDKFKSWGMDFKKVTIAAPFNKLGFQMNPSRSECERALKQIPETEVTAMSILAGGYISPAEAIEYISCLPNLQNVVVGVSRKDQAVETFRLLARALYFV